MSETEQKTIKEITKKLDNKKPIKLNDEFGTIIYVNKNADKQKEIDKYLKDLEDYRLASIMNLAKYNKK